MAMLLAVAGLLASHCKRAYLGIHSRARVCSSKGIRVKAGLYVEGFKFRM